jgi:hypothetical protein
VCCQGERPDKAPADKGAHGRHQGAEEECEHVGVVLSPYAAAVNEALIMRRA